MLPCSPNAPHSTWMALGISQQETVKELTMKFTRNGKIVKKKKTIDDQKCSVNNVQAVFQSVSFQLFVSSNLALFHDGPTTALKFNSCTINGVIDAAFI